MIINTNIINDIIRAIKTRKNNVKCYISFYNCYNNSYEKIPGTDDMPGIKRINTTRLYDYKVNLF